MSISKRYLKTKPVCKTTFKLLKEEIDSAQTVYLVGEFNDWNTTATPMKRLKNGGFTQTLDLTKGKEYQFRYLADDNRWINDGEADKYVPNHIGNSENCVITL